MDSLLKDIENLKDLYNLTKKKQASQFE